jgi:hypothetical protein
MGHLVLLLTSTVGCFVVAFELSGRCSGGRRELGRSIDFCTSGVCLEVESLGARRTILQRRRESIPAFSGRFSLNRAHRSIWSAVDALNAKRMAYHCADCARSFVSQRGSTVPNKSQER